MQYNLIELDTAAPQQPDAQILIIYTGGTFGMGLDQKGILTPFDFNNILNEIPSLKSFNLIIKVLSFAQPIDSSNIKPEHWTELGKIIEEYYNQFDGFVILHGTDTMAYTSSALSFIFNNLEKPLIVTGAQLPISSPRTDARKNLIAAIEIAAAKTKFGSPIIKEVCIFFNYNLIRGNRAKKVESMNFDAFESENYPVLAESGVTIKYNLPYIQSFTDGDKFSVSIGWDYDVAYLKLYPGISSSTIENVLFGRNIRGVVIETFGSGNAMTDPWFIKLISKSISNGLIIFNVSQCMGGRVMQGKYETSQKLKDAGVISGKDISTEAAITKMMYLLGTRLDDNIVKIQLGQSLKGEITD